MGWSITYGASKADTIRDLTKGWAADDGTSSTRCLTKAVRGCALYAVMETTYRDGKPATEGKPERKGEPGKGYLDYPAVPARDAIPAGGSERWIMVCLLGTDGQGNWGSKDMDESCGPCEVACPLAYLDMVPCPGGYATSWREKVREYHAKRAGASALAKRLATPGTIFTIRGVKPAIPFVSEGKVGRTLLASGFRIKTRFLRNEVVVHETREAAMALLAEWAEAKAKARSA